MGLTDNGGRLWLMLTAPSPNPCASVAIPQLGTDLVAINASGMRAQNCLARYAVALPDGYWVIRAPRLGHVRNAGVPLGTARIAIVQALFIRVGCVAVITTHGVTPSRQWTNPNDVALMDVSVQPMRAAIVNRTTAHACIARLTPAARPIAKSHHSAAHNNAVRSLRQL